ncbi:ThiF family adenylyltransferase [Fredinandcohnia sp. QZ13]|uniref:ThiF family adenylyltransferase n=1 Tax=Fredinandcohnia sp. QZ13 TaxID=3073144 RepID=UPI0028532DDE|nr:ThiF family adenylyltransferase [Fredinandcohnia sp. QZ13]MDR4888367.1 ThiF family adenylyltransferase [Fredinandcohnia sp. QZ13]
MSQELINRSPDLKRLRDEGFEIDVINGYALVHHVPYVNSNKEINYGTLVSTLCLAGDKTIKPDNHVIHFIGDHPCDKQGSILSGIQYTSTQQVLAEGISINHSFSNKPQSGYSDYYEKFTTYINVIMAPAYSMNDLVTAKTFRTVGTNNETVFNYYDTNSSRANIIQISQKLNGLKIGIIGLGGTGSYILDLVCKTPVSEIHIFDGDIFLQHNAFRAPGSPSAEELEEQSYKTQYFFNIYNNMHKKITCHNEYIDESNIQEVLLNDFVFISIDDGAAKKLIIDNLLESFIPFIDVGIGIEVVNDSLIGDVRVTTGTPEKNDHLSKRISFSNSVDDDYSTNIQIAELNALNAALAVIKWKKHYGFYQDNYLEHDTTYSINMGELINEDQSA